MTSSEADTEASEGSGYVGIIRRAGCDRGGHPSASEGCTMKGLPDSRAAAVAAGAEFYFTGKACRNKHVAKRRTRSAVCAECARMYVAREVASGKSIERSRLWRSANPEKRRKALRVWREANQDLSASINACAQALQRGATIPEGMTRKQVIAETTAIYSAARNATIEHGVRYEVDHIRPIKDGGQHCASNLQVLEHYEHEKKTMADLARRARRHAIADPAGAIALGALEETFREFKNNDNETQEVRSIAAE